MLSISRAVLGTGEMAVKRIKSLLSEGLNSSAWKLEKNRCVDRVADGDARPEEGSNRVRGRGGTLFYCKDSGS